MSAVLALAVPETAGFESTSNWRIEPVRILVEKNKLYTNKLTKNWSSNGAIFGQDFTLKFGHFKINTELNYLWGKFDNALTDVALELKQWSGCLDFSAEFGPGLLAIGALHLQDKAGNYPFRREASFWGLSDQTESPLYIIGKKVSMRWSRHDISNATLTESTGDGLLSSGFESLYLCASYKITDRTKARALFGLVQVNEIMRTNFYDGTVHTFDISFEWELAEDLTYIIDAGYFKDTDRLRNNSEVAGFKDLDTYSLHHDFVISW
jgi:hypothetical protein